MNLHPAIGTNRYCGPSALAIITGKSTDECAAALRAASGKRAIMRIDRCYMRVAMHSMGVKHSCSIFSDKPLDSWMDAAPAGRYLVMVTGHYVVVDTDAREVCDNGTVYPIDIDRYSKRRKRVREAWRIL